MADNTFKVKYVGPFQEGVEVNYGVVLPGETVELDEEQAAHLLQGDAFELVGSKKPKAVKPSPEIGRPVSPLDVHENPPTAADERRLGEEAPDKAEKAEKD